MIKIREKNKILLFEFNFTSKESEIYQLVVFNIKDSQKLILNESN